MCGLVGDIVAVGGMQFEKMFMEYCGIFILFVQIIFRESSCL